MATSDEVMQYLLPNGGYLHIGNDYEGIQFIECEPITKKEFLAGFAKYDAYKLAEDTKKAATKAALLAKLGITAEEAALLLS